MSKNLVTKTFIKEGKMYGIETDPAYRMKWTKDRNKATIFTFADAYKWAYMVNGAVMPLEDDDGRA